MYHYSIFSYPFSDVPIPARNSGIRSIRNRFRNRTELDGIPCNSVQFRSIPVRPNSRNSVPELQVVGGNVGVAISVGVGVSAVVAISVGVGVCESALNSGIVSEVIPGIPELCPK